MTEASTVIFNGFFSVDNTTDLVTAFYETINNSTDFNNSILANNNYQDADYKFINNNFTVGGTNINYMNYYNNQDSPGYNPAYAFFNLYKFGLDQIMCVTETGYEEVDFNCVFDNPNFRPIMFSKHMFYPDRQGIYWYFEYQEGGQCDIGIHTVTNYCCTLRVPFG
jgi:predicted 3-demethylubiquinone-9 3-methyltransferase (glyoxalase superfamily)